MYVESIPVLEETAKLCRLLDLAQARARELGRRTMRLYTGDKLVGNVAWYERHGFVLRTVNRAAYAELPDEIQLLWYLEL